MLLCTTSAHKLETVYDHKFLKMSIKESHGKEEKSQKKQTTSSPTFDEDKKEGEISAGSTSSEHGVKSVSTKKRKLKPDDTDIIYYNTNRKHSLKRLNVEVGMPKKRPKFSSSTQVASYLNNNQITSHSCSSDGTKDTKVKDCKLTDIGSKLDYEIKKHSHIKITKDTKSKAEGQTKEKNWPSLLIQKKMKELKKEKNNKDSSEELEKCKKNQLPQNYNFSNIIKEPFESGRKKISFKIPKKSSSTLQKLVEENIFSAGFSKSESKQEEKEHLPSHQTSLKLTRHKTENSFSGSTHKQSVCERKRKYHHEHQEANDSDSKENHAQSFEIPCSSVSSENIQDADEEVTDALIYFDYFKEIQSSFFLLGEGWDVGWGLIM